MEPACYQQVQGNITNYLTRLLTERGYYYTTQNQLNAVRKIKEKACYVALDYEEVCTVVVAIIDSL